MVSYRRCLHVLILPTPQKRKLLNEIGARKILLLQPYMRRRRIYHSDNIELFVL